MSQPTLSQVSRQRKVHTGKAGSLPVEVDIGLGLITCKRNWLSKTALLWTVEIANATKENGLYHLCFSQMHLLEPRCCLCICSAASLCAGIVSLWAHAPKALFCHLPSVFLSPTQVLQRHCSDMPTRIIPDIILSDFSSWQPLTGNSHLKEDLWRHRCLCVLSLTCSLFAVPVIAPCCSVSVLWWI